VPEPLVKSLNNSKETTKEMLLIMLKSWCFVLLGAKKQFSADWAQTKLENIVIQLRSKIQLCPFNLLQEVLVRERSVWEILFTPAATSQRTGKIWMNTRDVFSDLQSHIDDLPTFWSIFP
jgi:hypothetical protein